MSTEQFCRSGEQFCVFWETFVYLGSTSVCPENNAAFNFVGGSLEGLWRVFGRSLEGSLEWSLVPLQTPLQKLPETDGLTFARGKRGNEKRGNEKFRP